MSKKRIFFLTFVSSILLTTSLVLSVPAQEQKEGNQKRIFLFNSLVELEIEDFSQLNDPIFPDSEPVTLDLTVRFKLDIEKQFLARFLLNTRIGRWILFRDTGETPSADINITIENLPSWCTVDIQPNPVSLVINNDFQEARVQLSLTVTEDAPAFEPSFFNIKALFERIENWGIESSGSATYIISFTPGNTPNISVASANSTYHIPPINTTHIPVNISNHGTSTTSMDIVLIAHPSNWTISLNSPVTIPAGETRQISLMLTPPKNFRNETLRLQCTPKIVSTNSNVDDTLLEGDPIFLELTIINDGSLDENTTPGFEILIVVIAALFCILFKKKTC